MIDLVGIQRLTARTVATWFVRALLWLLRADVRCRGCELVLEPWQMMDFVESGCPNCQGHKLELVR